MSTTIQVQENTVNTLKLLRAQFKTPSYDELIHVLIKKSMSPQKSMWGAGGKLSMKEILKDLRDESDKY